MVFCRVSLEAHRHCATIYVAGFLAEDAASASEGIVAALTRDIAMLRVDLRAVDLIDPSSFVRVARALNEWRDVRRGRVTIEFPQRSRRESEGRHLRLVVSPSTNGTNRFAPAAGIA